MKTFLKEISVEKTDKNIYPYNLPLFKNGFKLTLKQPITFIVGENGTGKSTLLENLAKKIGFNTLGGNQNFIFENASTDNFSIADNMKLTWSVKQNKGFFFRAESFFQFANELDKLASGDMGIYRYYGGKSLQQQSHGESFLSLFTNRMKEGVFIFDEPEAALSPERQLTLISILNDLSRSNKCQFIIATHSPIIITVPNSQIFEIENGEIKEKSFYETKQFQFYQNFLASPERYVHYLCKDFDKGD